MTMSKEVLIVGIDQGTTGSTVVVFGMDGAVRGRGYREVAQSYPAPGHVEHSPSGLITTVTEACREACAGLSDRSIAAVGITNQRETTVLWDRRTGEAVAEALVWQDRRTAPLCADLQASGHAALIQARTGLLLDPYFSATKVAWLLDAFAGLRARAERGEIAFGTVDSWLVYHLSGRRRHVTDVSNASRTMLFDIHKQIWSDELLALFNIPRAILPEVVGNTEVIAHTQGLPGVPDGTPIAAMAGDQQAALYGQGCELPGDAKCTYGTGAFLLMNMGANAAVSRHRLLTSIGWRIDGKTSYVLEGSAFVAGALVKWLVDGLGIIAKASDIEPLAATVPDAGGVMMIPALAGLGAPYWRPDARGLVSGITRGTTRAHLARAALDAIALQTVDLVRVMESDTGCSLGALRVDGGASANDLLMQLQADYLGVPVIRPAFVESTVLGAARLAARTLGWALPCPDEKNRGSARFDPRLTVAKRQESFGRWKEAVEKA